MEEQNNEIELLIMVTPEFVDAMEEHEVPKGGPGMRTTAPNDVDLFFRGYLEVPKCCPDGSCANCAHGLPATMNSPQQSVQVIEPATDTPEPQANEVSQRRPVPHTTVSNTSTRVKALPPTRQQLSSSSLAAPT